MNPIFIGVAGGSGAGKSTLCMALQDAYPDKIGLLQLEDYFKVHADPLHFEGTLNWDEPAALDFDKFAEDLTALSQGRSVTVITENERLNPEFPKTNVRIPVEIQPQHIMLIDGFLVLWDKRVRDFFTTSLWLELDAKTRWERRRYYKDPVYKEKILLPMHNTYVEPTKKYADHIIDARLSEKQVFQQAEKVLQGFI